MQLPASPQQPADSEDELKVLSHFSQLPPDDESSNACLEAFPGVRTGVARVRMKQLEVRDMLRLQSMIPKLFRNLKTVTKPVFQRQVLHTVGRLKDWVQDDRVRDSVSQWVEEMQTCLDSPVKSQPENELDKEVQSTVVEFNDRGVQLEVQLVEVDVKDIKRLKVELEDKECQTERQVKNGVVGTVRLPSRPDRLPPRSKWPWMFAYSGKADRTLAWWSLCFLTVALAFCIEKTIAVIMIFAFLMVYLLFYSLMHHLVRHLESMETNLLAEMMNLHVDIRK